MEQYLVLFFDPKDEIPLAQAINIQIIALDAGVNKANLVTAFKEHGERFFLEHEVVGYHKLDDSPSCLALRAALDLKEYDDPEADDALTQLLICMRRHSRRRRRK